MLACINCTGDDGVVPFMLLLFIVSMLRTDVESFCGWVRWLSPYVRLIVHFPHDIDIAKFSAGDLTHQRDRVCVDNMRCVNENTGLRPSELKRVIRLIQESNNSLTSHISQRI